jgi:hypothetical protein
MHDGGGTGKSSMTGALIDFLGEQHVAAIGKDSLTNQFGFSSIYGKRLIVYGDCKNARILRTEKVHSILGGDTVSIERKNLQPFAGRVYGKLLIGSNIAPEINHEHYNEVSRLIYIPLGDDDDSTKKQYCLLDDNGNLVRDEEGKYINIGGNLRQLLLQEMEAFLFKCRTDYESLCPNGQDIYISDSLRSLGRDVCVSTDELVLDSFADAILEFNPQSWCLPIDIQKAYGEYRHNKAVGKANGTLESELKRYLMTVQGLEIAKTKVEDDPIRRRRWMGVRINEEALKLSKREIEQSKEQEKEYDYNGKL